MPTIFKNRTIEGIEHSLVHRYTMRIDWRQSQFCSMAGIAGLVSIYLMTLNLWVPCLVFAAVALILLWFRYLYSLRRDKATGSEVCTTFGEQEIVRLCNGEQKMFSYADVKRITFYPNWLLFEGRKLRFLVDAKGFDGLEAEDIFQHFRTHFPQISVKRKNFSHRKKQLYHLVLCSTVLFLLLTIGFAFKRPLPQSSEIPMSHDPKEYAGIPVEEQPRIPFDMDLFSIELPAGFSVHQNGEMEDYTLFGESNNVWVDVWFNARSQMVQSEYASVSDLAEMYRVQEAESKYAVRCDEAATIDKFGHLSFFADSVIENQRYLKRYYLFFETEHYVVTVTFTCNLEEYEIFAEHFDKWEASISVHDTPTGSLLRRTVRQSVGELSISLPLYMHSAKFKTADWGFCSVEDDRIQVQVFEHSKSDVKNASNVKEAFAEIVFGDYKKNISVCQHGNPHGFSSNDPDRVVYYILHETGDNYYLFAFIGPIDQKDTLMELFERWDGSVK